MKIDWTEAGIVILMVLWIGKEANLMPFIYGAQPCTPSITETAK